MSLTYFQNKKLFTSLFILIDIKKMSVFKSEK